MDQKLKPIADKYRKHFARFLHARSASYVLITFFFVQFFSCLQNFFMPEIRKKVSQKNVSDRRKKNIFCKKKLDVTVSVINF